MKSIDIFVDGKYDYKFQLGTWIYYMSYKTAVIKRTGTYLGYGSQTRSSLWGLYMALGKIKEPCYINIYSKVPLGFKQPKKSANKDLLVNIQTAVNKAGHILEISLDKEFSKPNMWEQVYGKQLPKEKIERTAKPSIENKKTPNEVFSNTESEQDRLKREWEELLNDNHGAWVPGSGGY